MKDKLIYQNDPRLNENIRKWGCRFRCLQAIAETWQGKALTHDQIEKLYQKAIKDPKVMKSNCECGEQEDVIINHAFSELGSSLTASQIGNQKDGKDSFYNGKKRGVDFIIDRWKTPQGWHFVLQFLDTTAWNPWDRTLTGPLKLQSLNQKLFYRVRSL